MIVLLTTPIEPDTIFPVSPRSRPARTAIGEDVVRAVLGSVTAMYDPPVPLVVIVTSILMCVTLPMVRNRPVALAVVNVPLPAVTVEAALAEGDAGFLARWIGEASGNRRRLLETAYDDAGELQRLRVHIPDRPGVIAGIAQALGAERINIAGFDLQHLSSERGGTLAILVAGEGEAARAAALLEGQGYGVVVAPVIEDES